MITLGLTTYRQESLLLAADMMRSRDMVVLEEPQTPGFKDMLRGSLAIDTYLQLTDFGFPGYAKQSCKAMREMFDRGIEFRQIDPFMDELVLIHEFFASGGTPQEIQKEPGKSVYNAEHVWTRELLAFYRASTKRDFSGLVRAVQDFARADASRGALRDRMRAEALQEINCEGKNIYIEAGYLHLALIKNLLQLGIKPRVRYVLEPVYKELCGRRQPLSPGDRLTWLYYRRPRTSGPKPDRLAAQALIYNKLITKDEMAATKGDFPHATDEVQVISLVEDLDFAVCRDVLERIRGLSTRQARAEIAQVLGRAGIGSA
ncbi:MAG: hypothetical protein ACLFSY_10535 [Desulfonatronovibrionaceae bacterium]